MKKILLLAGVLLLSNGIPLIFISNLNIGNLMVILLGAFLMLWGVYYEKTETLTRKGGLKYIKIAVIFLLCAELVLLCFISFYGYNDTADYSEDALIVLGCAIRGENITLPLSYRLNKAVEYHKKNPAAIIVVTGGRGFQESITEALAMERYLIKKGVPEDLIIKEEKATSTAENMRYSKDILDKYFDGDYKTALITNQFHIYRSASIAKKEGFENISHIHAGLEWYSVAPCYLRESLAVLKMWLFG